MSESKAEYDFWPLSPEEASFARPDAISGRVMLYHSDGMDRPFTAVIGVVHKHRSLNQVVMGRFATAEEAYLRGKEQLEELFSKHAQEWAKDL